MRFRTVALEAIFFETTHAHRGAFSEGRGKADNKNRDPGMRRLFVFSSRAKSARDIVLCVCDIRTRDACGLCGADARAFACPPSSRSFAKSRVPARACASSAGTLVSFGNTTRERKRGNGEFAASFRLQWVPFSVHTLCTSYKQTCAKCADFASVRVRV